MKKLVSILLVSAMVFTFAACGNDGSQESIASGDVGDYHIAIVDYELTDDGNGKDCIKILIDYTNNSGKLDSYIGSVGTILMQDGEELESVLGANAAEQHVMDSVTSGQTLRISELYYINNKTSPIEITVTDEIYQGEPKETSGEKLTTTISL